MFAFSKIFQIMPEDIIKMGTGGCIKVNIQYIPEIISRKN